MLRLSSNASISGGLGTGTGTGTKDIYSLAAESWPSYSSLTMATETLAGKSALIIGATGAVGGPLLTQLLESKDFTRVGEFGRRVTKPEGLTNSDKLEQKEINFDDLENAGLKSGKWDLVFITYARTTPRFCSRHPSHFICDETD